MFAHCLTVPPAAFLRSCFSFFALLSSLFLSLLLPLCFLLRLFLFSWIAPEAAFLSSVLPATGDRAFCISVEDLALLFPFSIEVPFPFVAPERSSFLSDFAHGWLVSICELVLQRSRENIMLAKSHPLSKCHRFIFVKYENSKQFDI